MRRFGLPIDEVLPDLERALAASAAAVLQAPPGAGKSTAVPLALLEASWLGNRRILVLEPRRVAARAVARRMSDTLGEPVGGRVGYRTRLDTRVSPRTRIEVVTEGVLARMLQSDPALEGVGLVVFDEFHERSLQSDLGLALCLDARAGLDLDLRVLAMSATLDGEALARLLGDAPVVTSMGRAFPVATHWIGQGLPALPGPGEPIEPAVTRAVLRALREAEGDVLVFLPGAAEIRRTQAQLAEQLASGRGTTAASRIHILPLYGELTAAEQDAALEPAREGERRIVLATNLAETSLTLPGIRVVVDSGLVRRARFDPATGMSRLETMRISRASADQRRGRAGRVAPGACYRLWSEGAERSLAAFTPPEIVEADLAPLALDLAGWGTAEDRLRWLDPPPAAMLASARDLLRDLGALDDRLRLTPHGRELLGWPAHPRLAHLLSVAGERGLARLGAELAALLGERDPLRTARDSRNADIAVRVELLRGASPLALSLGDAGVDRGALERARETAKRLRTRLESVERPAGTAPAARGADLGAVGLLLAAAYPDRVGRRRAGGEGRFQLANGRGAAFTHVDALARSEFIVAVELDDRDREARIQLAAAVDRADLQDVLAHRIERVRRVAWSESESAVSAASVERLHALVLDESPIAVDPADALVAVLDGIRRLGLEALPWDGPCRALRARVRWLRERGGLAGAAADWPDWSDAALLAGLERWLAPWLDGITRRSHFGRIALLEALRADLGYERLRRLDELAPRELVLPTGSRVPIDYEDDLAPCASMRMQEVFGLAATPRIAGGQSAVTFKLLSPARRPLQVTRDLASFWQNAYREVRKEMRGQYPRHYWPENPLEAEPTRGVKRRPPST